VFDFLELCLYTVSCQCGSWQAYCEPREYFGGACVRMNLADRPSQSLPTPRATPHQSLCGVLLLAARDVDDAVPSEAPGGSRGLMGFGVMWSPDRGRS